MAQLTLPVGKQEFHDGTNWFALATENWVINTIRSVAPCLVSHPFNINATYSNGTNGVGATLTNAGPQGIFTLDGVVMTLNDRVLIRNQNNAFQNGIYTVTNIGSASTNWVMTRAADYDVIAQTVRGDIVSVISGTVNSSSLWMMTSIVNTIGTDAINFSKTDQNTFTSIVGTANQISVSVASGVATLSIVSNPVLPGNGSVTIPTGTTANRPSTPTVGMFRFNTSLT